MLSADKLKLFISDMCTITGECFTPILHQQIFDLTRILTATGCGSWPLNTDDQNFYEYMSALSVAVGHLFNMPILKRELFVLNGLRNVNLTSMKFAEPAPSWIVSELDLIEWSEAGEFEGHVIYRPDVVSNTGLKLSIQCEPTINHAKDTSIHVGLPMIKTITAILHEIDVPTALIIEERVNERHFPTWRHTDDSIIHPPILLGSELKNNCIPIGSHVKIKLHNTIYMKNQLDELLYNVTETHLPYSIHNGTVPYLMCQLPVKLAASFMRNSGMQFCRKFSPRVKNTLTFLQNLATQTMCP